MPDAHADFVFSVLGEEFGFFICAFVVLLIAFIVVYGMLKALKENNIFTSKIPRYAGGKMFLYVSIIGLWFILA